MSDRKKVGFLSGWIGKILKYVILVLVSVFTAFPFVWMTLSALKTKEEVMSTGSFFPATPQWGNFVSIFFDSPILSYIENSMFVSAIIVLLQVVTGAMITYALVFFHFKGKNMLFAFVMGTYMLPVAATYIPSYIILSRWNMLNTLTGLIVSSTVSMFGIFLLRQAFMQVPRGLVEAARIDGASHFRILWEIVCPMTKSSFITFGLMSFISTYNNYMWPSLITNDESKYLVSQGLRSFFIEGGAYGTEWALVMAASAVIVLPLLVLFAFTQKWFINGIGGDTGMKG
ncbi:MAG: carbohydrate ABC transporter permease [Eubacteriales bacterium]|nr:carbohydrate ABC transporter permease [Eubacteriales bacterium]